MLQNLVDGQRPSRPSAAGAIDVAQLERELKSAIAGEVRFDAGSRALYATDASNYRQVADRRRDPEERGRRAADGAPVPALRRTGPVARRRHQPVRPVLQRRGGDGFFQVPEQCAGDRPPGQDRAGAARRGARRPAPRGRTAGTDLRARSVHAQPQHARRHDRQQFLRPAFGDGRRDGAQHHRAGRADLRRHPHDGRRHRRARSWTASSPAGGRRARNLSRTAGAARPLRGPDPRALSADPAPRLGLQPAGAAAGERLQPGAGAGRLGRHLRRGAGGDGAPARQPAGTFAAGARLPGCLSRPATMCRK